MRTCRCEARLAVALIAVCVCSVSLPAARYATAAQQADFYLRVIEALDARAAVTDAAAVMVQEGTEDKPGIILGAAFTPLEPQSTDERKPTATNGQ